MQTTKIKPTTFFFIATFFWVPSSSGLFAAQSEAKKINLSHEITAISAFYFVTSDRRLFSQNTGEISLTRLETNSSTHRRFFSYDAGLPEVLSPGALVFNENSAFFANIPGQNMKLLKMEFPDNPPVWFHRGDKIEVAIRTGGIANGLPFQKEDYHVLSSNLLSQPEASKALIKILSAQMAALEEKIEKKGLTGNAKMQHSELLHQMTEALFQTIYAIGDPELIEEARNRKSTIHLLIPPK